MTLVNVVPQVGPDQKTGVSGMGTFVGGSNPFPAPCVLSVKNNETNFFFNFQILGVAKQNLGESVNFHFA